MSAQDKFDQEYLDDLINDLERLRHERDEARGNVLVHRSSLSL